MTLLKEMLILSVLVLCICTDVEPVLLRVMPDKTLSGECCEHAQQLEVFDKH